jgi:hypothetical protein
MRALISRSAAAACLMSIVCLAVHSTVHAENSKAAEINTLEKQIDYLGDALSEGLRSMDWKMIEMAVEGLKAAKVTGKDAEVTVLKAERNASMEMQYAGSAPQILALGMSARALMGDSKARPMLISWISEEIEEVKPPDAALYRKSQSEYLALQKKYLGYTKARSLRDYAFLGLALLKEPGIAEKALAVIRATKDPVMQYIPGRQNAPVLAVLVSGSKGAFEALLEVIDDDKGNFSQQSAVLQTLIQLTSGKNEQPGYTGGGDGAFTIAGDVQGNLPQDAVAQLYKPYIGLMKRWQPNPNDPNGANLALNTLMQAGYAFPKKSFDAEAVKVLEELRDRTVEWLRPQVDQLLKNHGIEPSASKPPRPPPEF